MFKVTALTANGLPGEAEDELFSWFWGCEGYLREKATGRSIYQMSYMRRETMGSDPITDEATIGAIRAFWEALYAARERAKKAKHAAWLAELDREAPREYPVDPKRAKAWDDLHNEGGDGYNPYR